MNTALPANHEAERLAALHRYGVLDTSAEPALDDLAQLAAQICGVPISLVSLVDEHRQWSKAKAGPGANESLCEIPFCVQAIRQNDLFCVEDTAADERFAAHPLVTNSPGIRFYAGVPLTTPDGFNLGTLCVMDHVPRKLEPAQAAALRILSRQVMSQLELRQSLLHTTEEYRQAESALKRSHAFYHSLVESLPQNMFRKDAQGRFTFANQRFCVTVKKTKEEIIGKTDFDFFPAELAAKYQHDDVRVMETLQPFETVEAHQTPDCGKLYVQVLKTPLFDPEGRVIGVQGIFWDVTERKKIEEDLAYERDLLRSLLDNVPDSIYFKDVQSRFIRINKSLTNYFGLKSPDEALGKTDFDFFAAEHAQPAFEDEQRIILTGQPMVGKTEKETWADGRETWVLTAKVPFRNKDGAIIGTLGISKDITLLKQAEAELKKARDAAVESAQLKSEFLANMSHEIRTPMNGIIGMTGLLLDSDLTSEQRDFAETIRASADALLTIINDILDFSKIEAHKLAIEVIDFDLRDTVESTMELLAERAQSKNIELGCLLYNDVPRWLRGDPGRLRQVLTNLTGNAIKFTERGEVIVRVTRQNETDSHMVLNFSVSDTGIGIPPEAQHRIFQAFTQADGSMTRKYGGTGLGLAISKQLVELMQGQITLESEPGKGSTFSFTVRLGKLAAGADTAALEKLDLSDTSLLIVDDNATNRQILQHQVQSWRMRSDCAASGAEALAQIRRQAAAGSPYKLAILDMQMPEMDGLTLAKTIKADPAIASTLLVMLTSLGHRIEPEILRATGLEAYLVKPVKQSRLYDCLVTVMAGVSSVALRSLPADNARTGAVSPPLSNGKKPLRVLCAEDNPVNQKVALRQLHKLGYAADAVANGVEVLQALKQIHYDVLLMDCQMPQLDGYETTHEIRRRENERLPSGVAISPIRIIAMTANALEGDRAKCIAAGMNDYISKPVRIAELQAALQRGAGSAQAAPPFSNSIAFSPVLNEAVLQGLRELREPGKADPLMEVIDLFLADTPARLEKIQTAIAGADALSLEICAHSLKGSASNLGATRLVEQCEGLVRLARLGQPAEASVLLGPVREEFSRLRSALEEERKK